MIYLLDVSTLVALLTATHEDNEKVAAWLPGKKVAVCPLTELGYLRGAIGVYHAGGGASRLAGFF